MHTVSRFEAQSDKFDAFILLDVNIDVYRINKDKRYTIGLATTLDLDGTPDTGYYNQVKRNFSFTRRPTFLVNFGNTSCLFIAFLMSVIVYVSLKKRYF